MTNHGTLDHMDPVEEMICLDGYIDNPALWRRWVMTQVFRNTGQGIETFDRNFFQSRPYRYQWTTAANEIAAMSKMRGTDLETHEMFFDGKVITAMLEDYLSHMDGSGGTASVAASMLRKTKAASVRRDYRAISHVLADFLRRCPTRPDMRKSDAWKNAFYGTGAYYTLDNMIRFHGLRLPGHNGTDMTLPQSIRALREMSMAFMSEPVGGRAFFQKMLSMVNGNGRHGTMARKHVHQAEPAWNATMGE